MSVKVRIQKRKLLVFAAIAVCVILPVVFAQPLLRSFGVEVWISNQLPVIALDSGSSILSEDPVTGTTARIWFVFNVTDPDGEDNINESSGSFNLTLGTPGFAQFRYNSTCTNVSKIPADNVVQFNCSVFMQYFDNQSANWVANFTAADINNAGAQNDSETFTYNSLTAMSFPVGYINFSNLNLGQNDQAAGNPLILNNTGNADFDQINITAADLIGTDVPAETIAATTFAVNSTNAVAGRGLPLSTAAQVIPGTSTQGANLTLHHGHTRAVNDYNDGLVGSRGNQSLYFWVDVPASGLSAQKYNNTWNVTVVVLP